MFFCAETGDLVFHILKSGKVLPFLALTFSLARAQDVSAEARVPPRKVDEPARDVWGQPTQDFWKQAPQNVGGLPSSSQGWRVCWFNGAEFNTPVTSGCESSLHSLAGNTYIRDLSWNEYSVKWTCVFTPPASEVSTFILPARGAVRLWIDHKPMLDRWSRPAADSSFRPRIDIPFQAGKTVWIHVEYSHASGEPEGELIWSAPSRPAGSPPSPWISCPPGVYEPRLARLSSRVLHRGMYVDVPVIASDPQGRALTITATGLPAGISLNPPGLLSSSQPASLVGVATEPGIWDVTLSAGRNTSQTFTWVVPEFAQDPEIQASAAIVQQGMSVTPDSVGGSLSVAFSLPPNLASKYQCRLESSSDFSSWDDITGAAIISPLLSEGSGVSGLNYRFQETPDDFGSRWFRVRLLSSSLLVHSAVPP